MAFPTYDLSDQLATGPGVTVGSYSDNLTSVKYEDGLVIGRFAKLDAGSLDNLDGSETPVIAGVVLRDPTNAIESGSAFVYYNSQSVPHEVNYIRSGMVTVDVKAGETPAPFGDVFAENVAGADAGKALATGGVATNAEFIREVRQNVWQIRLK